MMTFVSGRGSWCASTNARNSSSRGLRVERRALRRRARRVGGASVAGVAVEEVLRAWEALDLGLVQGSVELVALGDGGEVEEGSGGGGDGDAVLPCDLIRGKNGAVRVKVSSAAEVSGGRDLHPRGRGRPDAPERRSGPVAEDRVGARGSTAAIHHPCRVSTRCPTAYTPGCTTCSRFPSMRRSIARAADAELEQLPPAHHPVLPPRQPSDQRVGARESAICPLYGGRLQTRLPWR